MNNTNFINILLFPNQSLQAKIDQQFSFQHVEQEERSFSSYLIENHRCFSAILEEKEFEFKDKQKFHQILQISELEGKIRWIFILLEEQSYFSSNPDPISYEKKIKANGQALSENIRIIYFSQKQLKNTQLTIYLTQYSDLKKELEITPFAFQYVFEKPPLKGEQELLQKILAQFINLCEKISNFIIKLTTYKEMITLFKLLVYIRQSLFQEVLKRFQIKKDKKYLYLIYLKQQSDVLFILKKITNNIFEKLAQLYKSDVCYCQTCNSFYYKLGQKKYIICPPPLKFEVIFDQQGEFNLKLSSMELENCKHQDQNSKLYFEQKIKGLKKLFSYEHCKWIGQTESNKNKEIKMIIEESNPENQKNINSNFVNESIQNLNTPCIILIGTLGTGKTTLFNKLCYENFKSSADFKSTQETKMTLCKSGDFYLIDTPAFEIYDENKKLDDEMVTKFGKIFQQFYLSQIFIVVDYGRSAIMKQKILDCLLTLRDFENKVSFLVSKCDKCENYEQDKIAMLKMAAYFGEKQTIFVRENDEAERIIQEIVANLKRPQVQLEQLQLKGTPFDFEKHIEKEKMFKEQLEQIKIQNKANLIESLKEKMYFQQSKVQTAYTQEFKQSKQIENIQNEIYQIGQTEKAKFRELDEIQFKQDKLRKEIQEINNRRDFLQEELKDHQQKQFFHQEEMKKLKDLEEQVQQMEMEFPKNQKK